GNQTCFDSRPTAQCFRKIGRAASLPKVHVIFDRRLGQVGIGGGSCRRILLELLVREEEGNSSRNGSQADSRDTVKSRSQSTQPRELRDQAEQGSGEEESRVDRRELSEKPADDHHAEETDETDSE